MYDWLNFLWRWLRARIPTAQRRQRAVIDMLEHAIALAASVPVDPALQQRRASGQTLISLVAPTYNTPVSYLDELLASFRRQNIPGRTDGLFELVLSDDGSTNSNTLRWLERHSSEPFVRIVFNHKNGGISAATNAGIEQASGEWIAFIDHDDALVPYALERIALALLAEPKIQFLYTDEVIADQSLTPIGCFLKPAWDEVLLSGVNYINHFSVYRLSRLRQVGLLQTAFDGSQDYDLVLRYTSELDADAIRHLPYPAYLWRRNGASFSVQFIERATARARESLREHYASKGCAIQVRPAIDLNLHRVEFLSKKQAWPKVSIIIPSRNARILISKLLDGLFMMTNYPNFEVIIVDNGTNDPEVLSLYDRWRQGQRSFTVDIKDEAFNFSRAVNRGVQLASGDALLLLNNDIEIQDKDWLREMVSCLEFPKTGVVGAKLLYPDRSIQHAGVIAGLGGLAGHWFIGAPCWHPGPMGRLQVRQSLSVVTGACMLISRECWELVGPLDEREFAVAYNDVDFCLRAVAAGFRVVWTPFAELIHHESASRGSDETPENIQRFRREQSNLRNRHHTDRMVDRAYSPWWTTNHSVPSETKCDQLPDAR